MIEPYFPRLPDGLAQDIRDLRRINPTIREN